MTFNQRIIALLVISFIALLLFSIKIPCAFAFCYKIPIYLFENAEVMENELDGCFRIKQLLLFVVIAEIIPFEPDHDNSCVGMQLHSTLLLSSLSGSLIFMI